MIPVVIFDDYIHGYGAIRGLAPEGIPIYIVSRTGMGVCTKSRYVRKVLTLQPYDRNFLDIFHDWVTREIGGQAILMVGGSDEYLDVLAQNHDKLLPGLKPMFPSWDIVKLVRQKNLTYEIAERSGVPFPKTHFITNREELLNIIQDDLIPSFPILLKTAKSELFYRKYGYKGVVCNDVKDMITQYDKHDGFYADLLLQEMIPGGDNQLITCIVILNADSEPIAVFMDKKRRTRAQLGVGTLLGSFWCETVLKYTLRLMKNIGYIGYASAEFKLDPRDGLPKFLEINGRISLMSSNALRCGLNIYLAIYREAISGPLPKLTNIRQNYPDNILWIELLEDLKSAISLFRQNKITLKEYFDSLKGAGYILEPFNLKDPKPGLSTLLGLGKSFGKLIRTRKASWNQ